MDELLIEARRPMLACVAEAGARSDLAQTHRCHRALRLLENARWLVRTVQTDVALGARVYNAPLSKRDFFCHAESLAAAKSATEVESRFIALIRAYP